MDFTALSHGQIQSKIWLCENLEPYLPRHSTVIILGCWYNILGMMMLVRKPNFYNSIVGVDIDNTAIQKANDVCQSFMIQPNVKITNKLADANEFDLNGYDVVINCSVEHMNSRNWFERVNYNSVVCIQSSDVNNSDPVWDIKDANNSLEELASKFPLSQTYVKTKLSFNYDNFSYNRFMLIGRK